jgi:hypothetical protein
MLANKRMKFAHYVRPTRKGDAPLLAAYARRDALKSRVVASVSIV